MVDFRCCPLHLCITIIDEFDRFRILVNADPKGSKFVHLHSSWESLVKERGPVDFYHLSKAHFLQRLHLLLYPCTIWPYPGGEFTGSSLGGDKVAILPENHLFNLFIGDFIFSLDLSEGSCLKLIKKEKNQGLSQTELCHCSRQQRHIVTQTNGSFYRIIMYIHIVHCMSI